MPVVKMASVYYYELSFVTTEPRLNYLYEEFSATYF
jgi:hypothetical protein